MIERAALLRRKAALLAELAQLELQLAELEDAEPAHKPSAKGAGRRQVRFAPPIAAPVNPPSDIDRARAKRELAKLGAIPGRTST